jgi:hypothetical protein
MTSERGSKPPGGTWRPPEARDQHVASVTEAAAHPWPFTTPDELAAHTHKVYSRIDDASFQELLSLVVTPPRPEEYAPTPQDDFDAALAECVATACVGHKDRLAQVCDLVVPADTRDRALDALYAFSFPLDPLLENQVREPSDEALPLLVPLMRRTPPLEGRTRELLDLIELIEIRQSGAKG